MIRWISALLVPTALMLAGLALPARAQPTADALQSLLDDFVRDQRLPGAVLAVAGPNVELTVTSGVLNRRTAAPVTPRSRFYVASVGKMITATAILQLVDEGRIRLDQPVAELVAPAGSLDELANWRSITVEQLLDHSSGLPDYFDDDYEEAALADRRMLVDVERALSLVVGQDATGEPGAAHDYSNTNYALLGLVLERVDQASLGAVLARRIFVPAGMTETGVGADPRAEGVASAHAARRGPSVHANVIAYDSRLGDGPITTTAGDLDRFLAALLRDKRLLRPPTLARMLAPSRRDDEYGLGIQINETDWGTAYGHDGSVTGFKAEAWYYAEHQTSIVFLTNGEYRSDDTDIVSQAATIAFDASR
jgi:D-alanyl-D-alanine carboxypeptidase